MALIGISSPMIDYARVAFCLISLVDIFLCEANDRSAHFLSIVEFMVQSKHAQTLQSVYFFLFKGRLSSLLYHYTT